MFASGNCKSTKIIVTNVRACIFYDKPLSDDEKSSYRYVEQQTAPHAFSRFLLSKRQNFLALLPNFSILSFASVSQSQSFSHKSAHKNFMAHTHDGAIIFFD